MIQKLPFALLAFVFFALVAQAQPSLSPAVHQPVAGDTVVRTRMTVPGFVPGPAGPGQVFTFAGAVPTGAADIGVFALDTGVAPWTYNMRADFDDGGIGYKEYYHITPDSISDAGFDNYSPDFTPFEKHNGSTKLWLSMGYGTQFQDAYEGQHASVGGPIHFTGTYHVDADAWGDLVLGLDTIPNVLRIHLLDTLRENFFGNIVVITRECYDFYATTIKFPVLSACTDPQNGNAYSFFSALRSGAATAITPGAGPQISLYPNPFQGRLKLKAQEPGLLQIMDLQGRVVAERAILIGVNELDFAELPAGAYMAVVRGESGVWERVVVRE